MQSTHAFVTGGGSGLGRAFALELARRGASVFVTDVNLASAEETARLVRQVGVTSGAAACDVRDPVAFEAAAERAEATLGPIDLCVNNAGVMVGGDIGTMPLTQWRFAIEINLWGAIHGAHVFTPRFKTHGGGRFLNVASIAGVLSPPETAPYNVSKAGIVALSETMYGELGKWNIRTTVLCPTAVQTGIFDSMLSSNPMHKKLAMKNARQPGPRTPEAIARIALDASDAGELYVFPQPDARAGWLVKRLFPRSFAWLSRTARTREWLEKTA